MSSFITHIAITQILKSEYSYDNKFILGAVLPDIYKKMNYDRNKTHFIYNNDKGEIPNIDKFCKEYINGKPKNLISYGYLMHLIEDKVWFSNYIPKYAQKIENKILYLKDNSEHSGEEFSKDIYEDYNFIDNYIISKYKLDIEDIKMKIENICKDKNVISSIEENINIHKSDKNRNNVFITIDDINQYIDETLNECRKVLDICIKDE